MQVVAATARSAADATPASNEHPAANAMIHTGERMAEV
jgi:hypothetical protein